MRRRAYASLIGTCGTARADAMARPAGRYACTLFAEVSLDALPASSAADDRQQVAHLYGLDNES